MKGIFLVEIAHADILAFLYYLTIVLSDTLLLPRFILFIYVGFYVAFNTLQVTSRQVVERAEETSTYSWLRFCTINW